MSQSNFFPLKVLTVAFSSFSATEDQLPYEYLIIRNCRIKKAEMPVDLWLYGSFKMSFYPIFSLVSLASGNQKLHCAYSLSVTNFRKGYTTEGFEYLLYVSSHILLLKGRIREVKRIFQLLLNHDTVWRMELARVNVLDLCDTWKLLQVTSCILMYEILLEAQ